MITTRNLGIGYSTTLNTLGDLTFRNGETVGVIGKNGIGKTTLLKTLAGLLFPTKGAIVFDGANSEKLSRNELAKTVSVLLTDNIAIRNITVRQMVAYGRYPYCGNACFFGKEDHRAVNDAIGQLQLQAKADTPFELLSDGEKQKTLIAKTIAQNTRNILLDEPTSHLDMPSKIKTLIHLKEWAKKNEKCVIFSIHETELAFQIADKILFMHNGQATLATAQEIAKSADFNNDFLCENLSFDLSSMNFKINYPQAD